MVEWQSDLIYIFHRANTNIEVTEIAFDIGNTISVNQISSCNHKIIYLNFDLNWKMSKCFKTICQRFSFFFGLGYFYYYYWFGTKSK